MTKKLWDKSIKVRTYANIWMGRGASGEGPVNGNVFLWIFNHSSHAMDYFQLIKRFFVSFKVSALWLIRLSLVNGMPNVPTCQVYCIDQKIKNIGFNEIKWRFVQCFQGWSILIFTLKFSFLKFGSNNTIANIKLTKPSQCKENVIF